MLLESPLKDQVTTLGLVPEARQIKIALPPSSTSINFFGTSVILGGTRFKRETKLISELLKHEISGVEEGNQLSQIKDLYTIRWKPLT